MSRERRGGPSKSPSRQDEVAAAVPARLPHRALDRVVAKTHRVQGKALRLRLLMLVECTCGATHEHRAQIDFTSGKRTAPCGRRYVLHAALTLAGAA